jgi:hypothetical protein
MNSIRLIIATLLVQILYFIDLGYAVPATSLAVGTRLKVMQDIHILPSTDFTAIGSSSNKYESYNGSFDEPKYTNGVSSDGGCFLRHSQVSHPRIVRAGTSLWVQTVGTQYYDTQVEYSTSFGAEYSDVHHQWLRLGVTAEGIVSFFIDCYVLKYAFSITPQDGYGRAIPQVADLARHLKITQPEPQVIPLPPGSAAPWVPASPSQPASSFKGLLSLNTEIRVQPWVSKLRYQVREGSVQVIEEDQTIPYRRGDCLIDVGRTGDFARTIPKFARLHVEENESESMFSSYLSHYYWMVSMRVHTRDGDLPEFSVKCNFGGRPLTGPSLKAKPLLVQELNALFGFWVPN